MTTTIDQQLPTAIPTLRPYQREAGRAIIESVSKRRGDSITIEVARQGGKNELSAQVEMVLLVLAAASEREAVKCAPTLAPQLYISMRRLWLRLTQARLHTAGKFGGGAISLGGARIVFLSAERDANVVGHTASLLLEVDEAQDVDIEKFDREFRPMAATANTTTVYYGTAWDDWTLLERAKQANLEAERRDGRRRHFEYDWQVVARHNPSYGEYVERERQRLGETHPLYLTQYCLKPIAGGGRLLTAAHRAQLEGRHARLHAPASGETYVAGLDLAGGSDEEGAPAAASHRDATVLTIGRLVYPASDALVAEPLVEIVEHYAWTGDPHEALLPRLTDLLRNVWRVRRVAVDATGLGETIARLLATSLGASRVEEVKFTAEMKSRLGFALLAAINGGRLKMYGADGSAEQREFWRQCELAPAAFRPNRTMNFYVDSSEGHDDYLVSAALLVRAGRDQQRRAATGRLRIA